ncbi:hypothetical protein [Pirellula sp. SH-Sr6A]|uniref:hypothetical protein n=1 Tax=Pirellula sp. SH-Sr6A TaxID=1632865 RepID=UPI0011BA9947|nr:hypothetical protein [Pirellula sp. SH-Sr6A]
MLTKPLGLKPENLLTLRLFAVHVQPAIATKPIVSLGWLTEIGIATVNLLRMNRPQLVEVLSQTPLMFSNGIMPSVNG